MHLTEKGGKHAAKYLSSLTENRLRKFAWEEAETETTRIQIKLNILIFKEVMGKNVANKKETAEL